jgi:putative ABC transport system permease protein
MSFALDFRHSLRALRHSRTATITSVLALGGGIGLLTALFTIVNTLVIRPLPYPNAHRVVSLSEGMSRFNWRSDMSTAAIDAVRRNVTSLEGVAAYEERGVNAVVGGSTVMLVSAAVTPNAFALLGERPLAGRLLVDGDQRESLPPVVISEDVWSAHFGRAPAAVGSRLRIDEVDHVVVGVVPERFVFPNRAVLWTPLDLDAQGLRWAGSWSVIGLLRPGITIRTLQMELVRLARAIEPSRPRRDDGWTLSASPDPVERKMVPGPIPWMFLAAGVLALLVVCTNVAAVLLARALARRPEMALRAAMGGTRARLVRLGAIEAMVLGVLGGVLGLAASIATLGIARASLPTINFPRWMDFSPDWRVLLFAFAAATIAALAAGIGPALFASRVNLADPLKLGAPGHTAARGELRLGRLLVAAEVALAFVLIACSGLFLKSARNLAIVDPGVDAERVLSVQPMFSTQEFTDSTRRRAFFERGLERLAALPGAELVASEGLLHRLWKDSLNTDSMTWRYDQFAVIRRGDVPGRSRPEPRSHVLKVVTPDYFRTVGFRLLSGRTFTREDREGISRVAVVSAAAAARYWPDGRAVGQEFRLARSLDRITVVGIVSDLHAPNTGARGLGSSAQVSIYLPDGQAESLFPHFLVRTQGNPVALSASVRSALSEIEGLAPVVRTRTLAEELSVAAMLARYLGVSFSFVAVGTWLLAAIGLYGIVSFTVVRRTRELGVRMALGADAARLRRDVLWSGVWLGLWGLAVGVPLTWGGATLVKSFLYGVSPLDPLVHLASGGIFVVVTAAATMIPARRATRVDPVQSLRA